MDAELVVTLPGCSHLSSFKVDNWKQNLRAIYQCFVWSGTAEARKRKVRPRGCGRCLRLQPAGRAGRGGAPGPAGGVREAGGLCAGLWRPASRGGRGGWNPVPPLSRSPPPRAPPRPLRPRSGRGPRWAGADLGRDGASLPGRWRRPGPEVGRWWRSNAARSEEPSGAGRVRARDAVAEKRRAGPKEGTEISGRSAGARSPVPILSVQGQLGLPRRARSRASGLARLELQSRAELRPGQALQHERGEGLQPPFASGRGRGAACIGQPLVLDPGLRVGAAGAWVGGKICLAGRWDLVLPSR